MFSMFSFEYFIIPALAISLFWLIVIYNRFVKLINQVDAAWSDINVQLKRRHDLIPKLVAVVKQFASYEQAVLSKITLLRSESENARNLNSKGVIEADISSFMNKLLLLVEDYPELKASQNFLSLQQELSRVEDTIQHARRFYNGSVRVLNTRIDTFPDVLVARLFNYQYAEYFQLEYDQ